MDGLKQRIVGALVLVCLAVIFVPMIFDEPHSERTSSSVRIPEEPPFPEVETPESDYPETPAYRLEEQTGPDTGSAPEEDAGTSPEPEQVVSPQPNQAPEPVEPADEPVADTEPATEEPAVQEADPVEESAEFTRSLEGAWVVQLGSFGNADNARRLRDKAREMGYSSHLQEVVRGENTLTRVFSGPYVEKGQAEKAKQALDKEFGVNSLITSGGD